MATKRLILATACAAAAVSQAGAAPVTFDFGNGTAGTANNSQDDLDPGSTINGNSGNWAPFANETTALGTSASITIGGLEMTISGSATDGNATADEFWGINNQGIGVITDGVGGAAGRRVDGTAGESISFSFDQDVTLTSLRIGSFQTLGNGDEDVVTVTPDGGSAITFTSTTDNAPTTDRSLGGVFVAAGTDIVFTTTSSAADGVLFNEITVDVVPEPGSLALLGLGGLLIARRRRG